MEFINILLPETPDSLARLDVFLNIAHSGLILFMLFGVFFRPLAPWHFAAVIIIWISWLGLGLYAHQLGYCIITDWHWQVKARLGEVNLPQSYITYLYGKLTGNSADNKLITYLTALVMLVITALSSYNFAKWLKRKHVAAI